MLCYRSNGLKLIAYSESSFVGDPDDATSTFSYAFLLGCGVVSWFSKKQISPTLSTMEAENVTSCNVVGERVWIKRLDTA